MPSDSGIPAIRTFQMDGNSIGNLRSSVNLFRGDVNYTQTLFSMPGRTDKDGLNVDVAIQYESNVRDVAMRWNRDQPTGILGMGWSLPGMFIALDDRGSPTPGSRSYSLTQSGIPSRLVREPESSLLFSMDAALAGTLVTGKPVSPALRAEFVKRGLPLSDSAIATAGAGWLLDDRAWQQQFTLVMKDGKLHAHDGGESYQLAGYRFWKIIYYPKYDRWAVTSDAGQTMSFGGLGVADANNWKTSAGNSIEWGVRWVNRAGKAIWVGSSAQTEGQQQYALVWNIAKVYNVWGDSISYTYLQQQQQVGAGGKPYTKACYLHSVTDAFGRKAVFNYENKLWSDATASSPREYADPHKAVPSDTPNGFQDRYETKYLDSIAAQHSDGSLLFTNTLPLF
jgi:large repetitive protein